MPTEIRRLATDLESRDVRLLLPELFEKVENLSKICANAGIELGIGTTVRGPSAQAKLWCRSRTPQEVERRRDIIAISAPTLASLLKPEWAMLGPRMTVHLPGQSWHQWGEAVDVCAIVGGMAVWDGSTMLKVAELSTSLGLFHSYVEKTWEPKSRHWHIQLRKKETPLLIRGFVDSWRELEEEMLRRFDFSLCST